MALNYNPKDAVLVVPEGDYTATLKAVEEGVSKAGNDMYVLTWIVHAPKGPVTLKDYVPIPDMVWKLRKIARALGRVEDFDAGRFDPARHEGKNLVVSLSIQEDEKYGDQNRIGNYKAREGAAPMAVTVQPEKDDEIPF